MHEEVGRVKYTIALILVGAALLFQPVAAVSAQGAGDPTPPPSQDRRANQLEGVWLRQQGALNRLEFLFDHVAQRLENAQEQIDRAAANGKDVGSLQAALDAFSAAINRARPDFEAAKDILNSHKGFDAGGNVTDSGLAATTVDNMRLHLEAIRDALLEPGRDLRNAIRDFRAKNRA